MKDIIVFNRTHLGTKSDPQTGEVPELNSGSESAEGVPLWSGTLFVPKQDWLGNVENDYTFRLGGFRVLKTHGIDRSR